MSLRAKVAPVLESFGGLDFVAALTKPFARRDLTILMYHRVAVPGAHPLLGDREISATPDEFEEQMAWLARFAHPIGFRDLLQCEKEERALPHRSVIVTFDDGYLDNYLAAFPILCRNRISATMFLSTGLVGTKESFWWDRVHAALRREHKSDAQVREETERLKRVGDVERRAAVDAITQRAGLVLSDFPRTIVSWDEVREMQKEGIDFGGHSVTHPVLSTLPPSALDEEIQGCKSTLTRELGKEPIAFAYPVGREFAISESVIRTVERAGFRYAVTTEFGRNRDVSGNRLRLRRIDVELQDSLARFKAKCMAPAFFRSRASRIT